MRRSGRDTDENLPIVSGETTTTGSTAVGRSPTGEQPAESVIVDESLGVGAKKSPETRSGSPEPLIRQPAGPGELPSFNFDALPVPETYKKADGAVDLGRFGHDCVQWGGGAKDAETLTNKLITNPKERRDYVERLRGEGFTSEMAQAWAAGYRYEHQREAGLARKYHRPPNTVNPTPVARATLLDLIAELLSRGVLSRFLNLRPRRQ